MGVVMSMNSYEIEHDSMEEEYGEEVMYAGWNPAVALVCQQHLIAPFNRQLIMPSDLATLDAESFLQKMYSFQR